MPKVSRADLEHAMIYFDANLRDTEKFRHWKAENNFAIEHVGRLYPVNTILDHVTGTQSSAFSAGHEAAAYAEGLGFKIVSVGAKRPETVRAVLERLFEELARARDTLFAPDGEPVKLVGELESLWRFQGLINEETRVAAQFSDGADGWAETPRIALLDQRETDTLMRGVHCALVFDAKLESVNLLLALGTRRDLDNEGWYEAARELSSRAAELRMLFPLLVEREFILDGDVALGLEGREAQRYEVSTVAYKRYEASRIPDNETLAGDLSTLLEAYGDYTEMRAEVSAAAQAKAQTEAEELSMELDEALPGEALPGEPMTGELVTGEAFSVELPDKDGTGDESPGSETKEPPTPPGVEDIDEVIDIEGLIADLGEEEQTKQEQTEPERAELSSVELHVDEPKLIEPEPLERVAEEPSMPEPLAALAATLYIKAGDLERIAAQLDARGQLIFHGPPGTGKTHVAVQLARVLAGDEQRVSTLVFHPEFGYEDFVEGYRYDQDGRIALADGPLKRIAARADENPEETYVLLLDEFNRADVETVLGELLYLLDRRGEAVTLARSGKPFTLPPNLKIIATLRTGDPRAKWPDAGLLRRFGFVAFLPGQPPVDGVLERWLAGNAPDLLWLVPALEKARRSLGETAWALPHGLFMREGIDEQGVRDLWRHALAPLIEQALGVGPGGADRHVGKRFL